ncbi:hypothetical protein PA01_18420 [Azoarcus sp. PA01]|nr:hypothetical protein PA01_18420 [Azoarcus sp. PA01]
MTDLRVGPIRVEETTGGRMCAAPASPKSAFISFVHFVSPHRKHEARAFPGFRCDRMRQQSGMTVRKRPASAVTDAAQQFEKWVLDDRE